MVLREQHSNKKRIYKRVYIPHVENLTSTAKHAKGTREIVPKKRGWLTTHVSELENIYNKLLVYN